MDLDRRVINKNTKAKYPLLDVKINELGIKKVSFISNETVQVSSGNSSYLRTFQHGKKW